MTTTTNKSNSKAKIAALTTRWRTQDAELVSLLRQVRDTFPIQPGHYADRWCNHALRPGWAEWCKSIKLKRKTADAIIDRKSVLP
jgi:hypothetical protein